jgi:hypothetical protein
MPWRKRKWRWLLGTGLLLLALVLANGFILLRSARWSPGLTRSNFDRIELGMVQPRVTELLDAPRISDNVTRDRWERTRIKVLEKITVRDDSTILHRDWQKHRTYALATLGFVPETDWYEVLYSSTISPAQIIVWYSDADNCVIGKRWSDNPTQPAPSWLTILQWRYQDLLANWSPWDRFQKTPSYSLSSPRSRLEAVRMWLRIWALPVVSFTLGLLLGLAWGYSVVWRNRRRQP